MANDTSRNNLSDFESEPAGPNQTPTSAPDQLYLVPGGGYQNWGTEVPTMPGTRVGDTIFNDTGDKWNWVKGDWDYANLAKPPSRDKGGLKPGDETPGPDYYTPPPRTEIHRGISVTPPSVTKREDQTIATSGGTTLINAPGRENPPVVPAGTKDPTTEGIVYGDPQRMLDYLARWSNFAPKPQGAAQTPSLANAPVMMTNQVPSRQAAQPSNPWTGYVNYDPDEILAAAMRVMNGRMAGRSMLNDLRR